MFSGELWIIQGVTVSVFALRSEPEISRLRVRRRLKPQAPLTLGLTRSPDPDGADSHLNPCPLSISTESRLRRPAKAIQVRRGIGIRGDSGVSSIVHPATAARVRGGWYGFGRNSNEC